MNTISAIKKRHPVTKYRHKKPNWRNIIEAIHSTQYAPMAGDMFTLKFLIVDDKELIKKISKFSEQEFIQDVDYVVLFITNPALTKNYYKENAQKYSFQQAGFAMQNFMLHLTDIGLGTMMIRYFNEEKIKSLLKIPEDRIIEALFPIGYEREKPMVKKAKGDIYNVLNFNVWGNNRMKKQEYIEGRFTGWELEKTKK